VTTNGPPIKEFAKEGKPGRGDDSPRGFTYFTPQKRRATLYEEVTVDTQPSIHRHMDRGYPLHFADGRPMYWDSSTSLEVGDWFDFRDPGAQWERPFYQKGTAAEHQIEGAVSAAAADHLFEDFSPEWVEFLREHLQTPAFCEQGLWLALATTARDCLSDTVAMCVILQASMKQRLAQAIVLYAMDLEAHFGEMPIAPSKQRFLTDPMWQPTREYVERLRTVTDWGEMIVACNLCFEPVVGVLYRRELGIRAARLNGDSVTPVIAHGGQVEWGWARSWSAEFTRFVLEDEAHGADNRERVAGWLDAWMPRAHDAAQALAPLADSVPTGISFDECSQRVERDVRLYHEEAGVAELTGVRA